MEIEQKYMVGRAHSKYNTFVLVATSLLKKIYYSVPFPLHTSL